MPSVDYNWMSKIRNKILKEITACNSNLSLKPPPFVDICDASFVNFSFLVKKSWGRKKEWELIPTSGPAIPRQFLYISESSGTWYLFASQCSYVSLVCMDVIAICHAFICVSSLLIKGTVKCGYTLMNILFCFIHFLNKIGNL